MKIMRRLPLSFLVALALLVSSLAPAYLAPTPVAAAGGEGCYTVTLHLSYNTGIYPGLPWGIGNTDFARGTADLPIVACTRFTVVSVVTPNNQTNTFSNITGVALTAQSNSTASTSDRTSQLFNATLQYNIASGPCASTTVKATVAIVIHPNWLFVVDSSSSSLVSPNIVCNVSSTSPRVSVTF